MSGTDPRRLDGHSTARRSALSAELLTVFLTEGFADQTLDGLAAKLRCSKSTLYTLAASKEQLVRAAVVRFFRDATDRVEAQLDTLTEPRARIEAYLTAVSAELTPASAAFFDDVAGFAPAREVYERNTRLAAERVQDLIGEGVAAGTFRDVPAAFIADVIATAMVRIQQRQVAASTGLSDAEAYAQLAALLVRGISVDGVPVDGNPPDSG